MLPTKVIYRCHKCKKEVEIVALDQIVDLNRKYKCADCESKEPKYINNYTTDDPSPLEPFTKSKKMLKVWDDIWESLMQLEGEELLSKSKELLNKLNNKK